MIDKNSKELLFLKTKFYWSLKCKQFSIQTLKKKGLIQFHDMTSVFTQNYRLVKQEIRKAHPNVTYAIEVDAGLGLYRL